MQPTVTTKQAAERLGVTPRAIHNWILKGQFPNAFKLNPDAPNSPYRIPEQDVEAFEGKRQAAS